MKLLGFGVFCCVVIKNWWRNWYLVVGIIVVEFWSMWYWFWDWVVGGGWKGSKEFVSRIVRIMRKLLLELETRDLCCVYGEIDVIVIWKIENVFNEFVDLVTVKFWKCELIFFFNLGREKWIKEWNV